MRKLYRYWRDEGIDVTSEWVFGLRDDRFVGLQPWCWHQEDKVEDLPNELYCSTKFLHSDMWFIDDRLNPPNAREKFYLEVMPWYNSSREEILDDKSMIDGTDICMPAPWCKEKTMIAYSQEGCETKTWAVAADWKDVGKVNLARITYDGVEPIGEATIVDGKLTLSLDKNEAIRITV